MATVVFPQLFIILAQAMLLNGIFLNEFTGIDQCNSLYGIQR